MKIRMISESDYPYIISVINNWWSGRAMADMLPRLFFKYFQDTSFIAEANNKIIGFLIGFISQSNRSEAYIHFIGVHPEYRNRGLARQLYELFINTVAVRGCITVHCVTSPVNKGSIAFHKKMGFTIKRGDTIIGEIPATLDYDGSGEQRVLFCKVIGKHA